MKSLIVASLLFLVRFDLGECAERAGENSRGRWCVAPNAGPKLIETRSSNGTTENLLKAKSWC
jgi:hypothetical protein